MMIVGMHSGKEFIVTDTCYTLTSKDGGISHILLYPDGKRQITVKREDIEFFDELVTEDVKASRDTMVNREIPEEKIGVEYQ